MTKRTKKILANVSKPLIEQLNEKVSAAFLQRDAYLDHVFHHEARMLDKEIDEPNSPEARDHLSKHLGFLDRKAVNFSLRPDTVVAMDDVCRRKNIPRDSFINRVVLFLIAKPVLFESIIGIDIKWYWTERVVEQFGYSSPLVPYHLNGNISAIEELVTEDPFWARRSCIEEASKDPVDMILYNPLHKVHIPDDLFEKKFKSSLGFNCYLPDKFIEGHPAEKAWRDEIDQLFDDISVEFNQRDSGGK